jgi:hypothetical protein
MTDAEAETKARQIIADFATSYRDDSPVPTVGTAPPVAQPGRPPMSQKAVDASALMLSAGVASLPIGGMTSLVLYALGHVDPVSLGIGAGAPVVLVLAISRLLARAKQVVEAAPAEHHHHYAGDVYQRHSHSENRSVWNKTINKR